VLVAALVAAAPAHASSTAHWAPVVRRVVVREQPNASAPAVARLATVTPEWTQNLVLVLGKVGGGRTWYRVRLPILPSDSTGWVPRDALGNLYTVRTHLYVDRSSFTATLERDGRTIFRTRVGVGRPSTPTPAGEFYIRDAVDGFHDPFYGPIAFGTSARAALQTDWPGGRFIGVHGTNRPELLPGAVSHGCIRMTNRAIRKLAKLMPVGTPLTIT